MTPHVLSRKLFLTKTNYHLRSRSRLCNDRIRSGKKISAVTPSTEGGHMTQNRLWLVEHDCIYESNRVQGSPKRIGGAEAAIINKTCVQASASRLAANDASKEAAGATYCQRTHIPCDSEYLHIPETWRMRGWDGVPRFASAGPGG